MITVKFTKNPAGNLWVDWAEYENGTWFASGRTLDALVRRMKTRLWNDKHVSARQIYLDTKRSDISEVPMEKMTKLFRTKFWKDNYETVNYKNMDYATFKKLVETPAAATPKPAQTKQQQYDYYEYKVRDGKLIVYGIVRREIHNFDLRKNNAEGVADDTNEQ